MSMSVLVWVLEMPADVTPLTATRPLFHRPWTTPVTSGRSTEHSVRFFFSKLFICFSLPDLRKNIQYISKTKKKKMNSKFIVIRSIKYRYIKINVFGADTYVQVYIYIYYFNFIFFSPIFPIFRIFFPSPYNERTFIFLFY